MLDEEEFAVISEIYAECMQLGKRYRQTRNATLDESPIDSLFRPVREAYYRITGWADVHQNAILHHKISIYGPPCAYCKKPLRTPEARFCAACGTRVEGVQ